MKKLLLTFAAVIFALHCRGYGKEEGIRLHGIVVTDEGSIAALTLSDGSYKWCSVGQTIGDYKVLEIKQNASAVVVIDGAKQIHTLPVQRGNILKTDTSPNAQQSPGLIPLDQLNWAWIKSDENFMRKQPEPLPDWAIKEWIKGDENFRIEMKNYYRTHGWDITRVEVSPKGRERQSISPLRDPSIPSPTPEERQKTAVPATPSTKQ
jgi:hypothetical protein